MSNTIENNKGFTVHNYFTPNKSLRLLRPFLRREVVLVHATASGPAMSGTINWFQNPHSKVSADFVIGKEGDIARMVPPAYCAWHAGICSFKGQTRHDYNYLSYGIELVNRNDGQDPYPDLQLSALAYGLALIQKECPTVRYIRRHCDVAVPSGRKSDPNGLSLEHIYRVVGDEQPGCHYE